MADILLQEFQASIDRLNGLKTRLEQKSAEKATFNENLVGSLKGINDKIAALAKTITDFKLMVTGLQEQVNNNAANVTGKEGQIDSITQQVTKLEDEKKQLIVQFTQAQEQINKQGTDTQQKINECETQLLDLTTKNAEIQKQLDAANAELSGRGEKQTQHAEELQKQAEESRQQLENQSNANKEQQAQLTARINELETKLQDLEKQLLDKTVEVAANVDTINKKEQDSQAQIAGLTAQVDDLKTKNEDLINRIAAATGVINDTVQQLQKLIENEPNPNEIQNKIAEIELSIENIARVIQGQPVAQQGQGQQVQNGLPGTTQITINGTTLSLDDLKKQLSSKSQQLKKGNPNQNNKYGDTLVRLIGAQTPEDVVRIVNSQNVFGQGKVNGGKKTKKNRRKQKGGFTYKNKANRRTITTSKQAGGFIYKDSAKRSSVTTSSTKRKRRNSKSM